MWLEYKGLTIILLTTNSFFFVLLVFEISEKET